jgi:opacity protein-like surface antigen
MKRLVRCTTLMTVLTAWGIGTAHAQAAGTTGPDRGYADFTFGTTLGHRSSSSVGGEAGYTVTDALQLFLEGGRMGDVATTNVEALANVIANDIGGSASTTQRAAYFDIGVKYRLSEHFKGRPGWLHERWRPYGLLGVGSASVKTTTNVSIAGTDVTSQLAQYNVQLGSDLSGTVTKAFLTVGVGTNATLGRRYLLDLSYRYGRIFSRTSEIPGDQGINTNRLQAGFGIRF